MTHSLKYFSTASSGVPNLPEFAIVGLVDEVEIDHYDSNTRRAEPKQDWMIKVTEKDPQYWERETEISKTAEQASKSTLTLQSSASTELEVCLCFTFYSKSFINVFFL